MARKPPLLRFLADELLKTEHFKNTVTLILTMTYCYLMVAQVKPDSQFSLLVGMVLGFYFKSSGKEG